MVDFDTFSDIPKRGRVAVTGDIQRQLGELSATLRAFREDVTELKSTVLQLDANQRASAEDRRTQQQIVMVRLERLERTASNQHEVNTKRLDSITSELAALKPSVDQFVSIRKRAGTIFAAFVSIGAVVWTLAQPIWSFLLTKLFGGSPT